MDAVPGRACSSPLCWAEHAVLLLHRIRVAASGAGAAGDAAWTWRHAHAVAVCERAAAVGDARRAHRLRDSRTTRAQHDAPPARRAAAPLRDGRRKPRARAAASLVAPRAAALAAQRWRCGGAAERRSRRQLARPCRPRPARRARGALSRLRLIAPPAPRADLQRD